MSNSFLYRKILTPRRLMIDYQAPPICEGDFTSTGASTISLLPILRPLGPTGLVMNWDGTNWYLTWNIYPGALCYSIYRLADIIDPFSEWVLVAECVTGNNITLPPGIYGMTVITLDGESEPSDPVEAPVVDPGDPPPVIPPPVPSTCPPETGTETPNDLMIPEDTDLGDMVLDPFNNGYQYHGTFDEGMYEISYQGGAWKDETNPYPDQFKLASFRWIWNDTEETNPLLGNSYGYDTQAEVEAAYQADCGIVAALCTQQFIHEAGQIGLRMIRFGTPDTPVAGSPNPTYNLRRVGTWNLPERVRIAGYDPNNFELIGSCNANSGGQDPWPGTFDFKNFFLPFWFEWRSSVGLSSTILGKVMVEAKVYWWTANPSTSTGAGWKMEISFYNDEGIIDAWTGVKNVGATPVGIYYRDSGCLTSPGCLTLESY